MIFFKAIRTKIGHYLLKSELKKRNREVVAVGLSRVSTLGIIFDASQKTTQNEIKAFLKTLPKAELKYSVIGFIPDSKIEHNYISDKTWLYFTEKDCDFFIQPKSEGILDFCNKKFDLLLVLDTHHHFQVEWITSMSLAKFKAGKSGDYDPYLDFMMDIHDQSTERLLKELNHYLNQLNKE